MAEKSSTKTSTRIGIIVGAVTFLLTSIATSVFVIIDAMSDKDDNTTTSLDSTAANCSSMNSPTVAALDVPEAFKPEGDVAELQTTTLSDGEGEAAAAGDCLIMKYYGTLAADGTMFDENYTKDTGFEFELGTGAVIPGWDQGLVGMKAGEVRRLVIPANLAYGETGQGSIPANADLVFVVKLESIKG